MDVFCFILILIVFAIFVFVTSRFVLRFEKIERIINEILESEDEEDVYS